MAAALSHQRPTINVKEDDMAKVSTIKLDVDVELRATVNHGLLFGCVDRNRPQ